VNKLLIYKRRIIQSLSLVLLHSSWGPEAKWLCLPVLSCHSCRLSWFACPVGVLVQYAGNHLFPFFALGTLLRAGVLFGRLFCGWVCPFGFLQDLLFKLPTRKFLLPRWTRWLKYGVLGAMALAIPYVLGGETLYSFCRVCPASALQVSIPNLIAGSALSGPTLMKLGFLAGILVMVVATSRAFCKILCPLGALFAPLNHLSFWTVGKVPEEGDCLKCGKCDRVCMMDGAPSERIASGVAPNRMAECIVCHECGKACPVTVRELRSAGGSSSADSKPPAD